MIEWHAHNSNYRQRVDLVAFYNDGNQRMLVQPVVFEGKTHAPGGRIDVPTISLELDSAQTLFQALWDEGFRPNNGEGTMGHLKALQDHVKFAEYVATTLLHPPKMMSGS